MPLLFTSEAVIFVTVGRIVSDDPRSAGRQSSSSPQQQCGAIDDDSQQARRFASDPSTPVATAAVGAGASSAAVEGGAGGGITAPYRLLCELVTSPGELDRHFLRRVRLPHCCCLDCLSTPCTR